jgi:nucleoside 2-deoxyribosyltransferase
MTSVYIICAVRNATPERVAHIRAYADRLRGDGYAVHFPPDDAPQDDPTGAAICHTHLVAMERADEVHVFWDVTSSGSHFDLGMAYALGKRIVPVECEYPDPPGKSYWKVIAGGAA